MLKVFITLASLFLFGCNTTHSPKLKGVANKEVTIYYIHREHCPGCEYMDRVLQTPEIKALLKNGYKLVVLDVNNQKSLPANLEQTRTTPTFYFIDSANRKVAQDEHILNPEQFKKKLLEIKDK